ncbi:crotonobetaine/carnitine-CoA ligase [Amycolatopsis marina]|uniref:Crotonobetaine/carnitine-CoA ligase n=1 Tax=Amycolatopsis marina TaxID=490629 RepID=A0A1I1C6E6_9PSEU|nr:AMP-binding protein [Amycolatopsis marina]SFB56340.1 crotonobetaine/carnitine-CoA ligase [Amycolatopsis marina]
MDWIQSSDLLPYVLRRRSTESPDTVYLRHVDGGSMTYRQSYEASLLWADALRRLGVAPGENVVSMLPNGFDTYHAWLGMAWLGAVEVSLNTAYQGRLLRYTISKSRARVMIVSERYVARLAEIADELDSLETVVVLGEPTEVPALRQRVISEREFFDDAAPVAPPPSHEPRPWDVSCIIWTSGTTGPSKGVMVPWAEWYRFCEVITSVTGGDDSIYHFMPPFHVGGKIILYAALLEGSVIVMRETFSSSNFWSDVRKHEVTHTILQGPMVRMLMSAPESDSDRDNSLRTMGCAPLPVDLFEFMERFGMRGANTYYGMTEIGLPFASPGFDLTGTESCGKLRDGYEVRIVDEHDYPVEQGDVGELVVRADHPWTMNAGYFGMAEETAHSWRNGWFHTGDGFRVDEDGNFYFVDRLKDAIRRRGENISSFEVEGYVNEHPEVVESAAVAIRSELGEDDVKVFVALAEGSALGYAELADWLAARMPRFMIPRYIEFVDGLPKTDATLRTKKADLRARGLNENTWDGQGGNGNTR